MAHELITRKNITPFSSTNKTQHHEITEIMLKLRKENLNSDGQQFRKYQQNEQSQAEIFGIKIK
jgi:hypothetical protein